MNYNLYMTETTTDLYSLLEYIGNFLSKRNQTLGRVDIALDVGDVK